MSQTPIAIRLLSWLNTSVRSSKSPLKSYYKIPSPQPHEHGHQQKRPRLHVILGNGGVGEWLKTGGRRVDAKFHESGGLLKR
jgi:hypothetical protein